MYSALYQYLLQHKNLPVPGIGTFLLERKPALSDFANRKIHPPTYTIALNETVSPVHSSFYNWIGALINVPARDAVLRFNDFVYDVKKQIGEGDEISWNGVGTLSKGLGGGVKFIPQATEWVLEQPVTAEKVIREKAEHMVRVGEDEKTSEEMTEFFNKPTVAKSYWWVWAAAIALLALLYTGWHFSEHGVAISSTANGKKLVPLETQSATYQSIP
jgi:hypothetical protein